MLTPTDIHYIVGLLSHASHPNNVEVELGSMVFDDASQSSRDVDVTIMLRTNSTITAFKGIEVKAHSRKLGTEGVEQLALKLNDMPSITERAIVSASGYTRPAIRKAAKHGIDLYELCDWRPAESFDHFKCETVPSIQTEYGWADSPNVHLNPGMSCRLYAEQLLQPEVVVTVGAETDRKTKPIFDWLPQISALAAQEASKQINECNETGVNQKRVKVGLNFSDNPRIEGLFGTLEIKAADVTGLLELRTRTLSSVYKALFRLGDPKPIAGCCISDAGTFGLFGLIVSENRELQLIRVPVAARNKAKIYREKIEIG